MAGSLSSEFKALGQKIDNLSMKMDILQSHVSAIQQWLEGEKAYREQQIGKIQPRGSYTKASKRD